MSNSPTADDEFTPEDQERIRAHIKDPRDDVRGLSPGELGELGVGVFSDAKEAAFVAFQTFAGAR